MVFDATFWVAISFIIFFGVLIYLKVPLKINENLNKLISDIKNELNESEKLRRETKVFLDQSQSKLNSASDETKVIICLLYTSPSPRDRTRSRMPSSA